MLVDNVKKIIVLSVPKTGTRSLTNFFIDKLDINKKEFTKDRFQLIHQTIPTLISKNFLRHNISEYAIYGICRHPIERLLSAYDMRFRETSLLNRGENSNALNKEHLLNKIREEVLNGDIFSDEKQMKPHFALYKQTLWLKYNGENINHIYKYENYDNLVADLCSIYDIDYTLFAKSDRLNERYVDISESDLSQDIKDKIIEYYAEDLQIYESL